jgi:iron complex outermembrane recepter protein
MKFHLKPLAILIAALPFGAYAQQASELTTIVIKAEANQPLSASTISNSNIATKRATTSDTASLLRDIPGVSLYGAGGVSSLPSIHGLADDRIRTLVDGMDLIASCPNHMNSPLSYIDPTNVESIKVYAGITPVSVGGDSIGGTIQVNSAKPVFAQPGEGILTKGQAGTFFRSNGNATGANISATIAGENLSFYYRGSQAEAGNYKAAESFKAAGKAATDRNQWLSGDVVGSSRYKTQNEEIGAALRHENHLIEAKIGIQTTPYEAFPNQRMDMTDNRSTQFNLRYTGSFQWGSLEARAFKQDVKHSMDFGDDKRWYGTGMPMKTKSETTGVSAKANIALSEKGTLRVGTEILNYKLNDWWPPVSTMTSMMGPNDNWNIRDGRRDRLALFSELETQHTQEWMSLLGIRREIVTSNTGNAAGYNNSDTVGMGMMSMQTNYLTDSNALNGIDRKRTDQNWDLTALSRYTPSDTASYEGGYARKTRSPNLYERYTWSTSGMSAIMNNFVGDGNGYVGDPDLKPEIAHTLSISGSWHDAAKEQWGLRATPYYTYVQDYIDAKRCSTSNCASMMNAATQAASNKFVVLNYANQSALLYGLDISGFKSLGKTEGYGSFTLTGLVNYARGQNRETGDNLYNLMPLNTKLALVQKVGNWTNVAETQFVSAKTAVSAVRNEAETKAYELLNLRTSYDFKQARLDFGIENVLNRFYQLPLGGAYTGQGSTMGQNSIAWGVPVPGMGRTFYAGLNVKF